MSKIFKVFDRLESQQNMAYSLIRIFLGLALLVRGGILVSNPGALIELIGEDKLHMWFSYVTIGHLLGGLSLTLGLYSRVGALMQIPILLGAVFMVHREGFMMGGQSLELAILVLFLLVIYFLFGAGPLSLNRYFHLPSI